MTIGQRISELRKNHGYSQEYVAEQLGVSRQAVSKWETDASAPDTYNLIGLAQLFGVSVAFIAVGKKEEEGQPSPQGTASNPIVVTNHYRQGINLEQVIGVIMLIFSLVCGILTITVDDRLLPIFLILVVCTIACFIQIKHKSIVVWWGFWIFDFLLAIFGMTSSPFLIFNPANYQPGLTGALFYGYFTWLYLVGIVIYTIRYFKRQKSQNNQP